METTEDWPVDHSDLRAVFVNCTLKRSPEVSNTEGLASLSQQIMRERGVAVETIRAVDHDIATGVQPDMTEHGWETDEWPALFERIIAADILVICTPIWLGEKSSVCTRVIERLYGNSSQVNDTGQWAYYGRVGGCLNDFTNRNTTFMTWNLLHLARMLRDGGGIPAYGNQPEEWKAGRRFGFPGPAARGPR